VVSAAIRVRRLVDVQLGPWNGLYEVIDGSNHRRRYLVQEPVVDEVVDAVRVGSVVTIRGQSDIDQDMTIVDTATGHGLWQLTTRTPLGRALLGRRAGEEVTVVTDAGSVKFRVVNVRN
jgi:transcription elongation GreA/GreB family factor